MLLAEKNQGLTLRLNTRVLAPVFFLLVVVKRQNQAGYNAKCFHPCRITPPSPPSPSLRVFICVFFRIKYIFPIYDRNIGETKPLLRVHPLSSLSPSEYFIQTSFACNCYKTQQTLKDTKIRPSSENTAIIQSREFALKSICLCNSLCLKAL